MAELLFDQLSPEEKEDVVSFYNSQNMNIGSPLTVATLPDDTVAIPTNSTNQRSWRDDAVFEGGSSASPEPELVRQGTQGAIVNTIQEALNNNGADLVVDGVAGPRTLEAAAEFQRNTDGLIPDGRIGAQTIGALMSPRLDTKGGEVAGVTTKAYDFLTKAGFTPAENQLISEKMAITGTGFTNRADALEFIDNSLTFEPTRKAAFTETVDAESGSGLVEGTDYSLSSAIANLGGGYSDRIARIRQLYGDSNRLTPEQQVELLDIAYGGRMNNAANEGHKYRGRGLIQITGKENYLKYGKAIGVGDALVRDPDILLNNPSVMLAITEAYLKDRLPDREDGLSANDLKDAIGHSGSVPEGVTWNGTGRAYKGNQRWLGVIGRLEAAGKQDEADTARLNNEFTAQEKVGTYIDGDIGSGSTRAMRSWLTERDVTIPEGANGRELVRLVNGTE